LDDSDFTEEDEKDSKMQDEDNNDNLQIDNKKDSKNKTEKNNNPIQIIGKNIPSQQPTKKDNPVKKSGLDSDEDLLISSEEEEKTPIKKNSSNSKVERDEFSTQEMTPVEKEKLEKKKKSVIQKTTTPILKEEIEVDPLFLKSQIENLYSIINQQNKTIQNLQNRIEVLENSQQPSTPILPSRTKSNSDRNKIIQKINSSDKSKKRKFDKK
jgi:hypothetical protein